MKHLLPFICILALGLFAFSLGQYLKKTSESEQNTAPVRAGATGATNSANIASLRNQASSLAEKNTELVNSRSRRLQFHERFNQQAQKKNFPSSFRVDESSPKNVTQLIRGLEQTISQENTKSVEALLTNVAPDQMNNLNEKKASLLSLRENSNQAFLEAFFRDFLDLKKLETGEFKSRTEVSKTLFLAVVGIRPRGESEALNKLENRKPSLLAERIRDAKVLAISRWHRELRNAGREIPKINEQARGNDAIGSNATRAIEKQNLDKYLNMKKNEENEAEAEARRIFDVQHQLDVAKLKRDFSNSNSTERVSLAQWSTFINLINKAMPPGWKATLSEQGSDRFIIASQATAE